MVDGSENSFSKFADNTGLKEVTDKPEGHAAIQRDLDRVEKWDDRNLIIFNKEKYQDVALQRSNPRQSYIVEASLLESTEEPGDHWEHQAEHKTAVCLYWIYMERFL